MQHRDALSDGANNLHAKKLHVPSKFLLTFLEIQDFWTYSFRLDHLRIFRRSNACAYSANVVHVHGSMCRQLNPLDAAAIRIAKPKIYVVDLNLSIAQI